MLAYQIGCCDPNIAKIWNKKSSSTHYCDFPLSLKIYVVNACTKHPSFFLFPSSRPLNSFRAPYFLRCAKISAPKPTVSKPNESLKAFGLREDGSTIDTFALETRLGHDPSNFRFKMPV